MRLCYALVSLLCLSTSLAEEPPLPPVVELQLYVQSTQWTAATAFPAVLEIRNVGQAELAISGLASSTLGNPEWDKRERVRIYDALILYCEPLKPPPSFGARCPADVFEIRLAPGESYLKKITLVPGMLFPGGNVLKGALKMRGKPTVYSQSITVHCEPDPAPRDQDHDKKANAPTTRPVRGVKE